MQMMPSSPPWWRTDLYDDDTAVPDAFHQHGGPRGIALVRTYGEKTDAGWGLIGKDGADGFMPRYLRNEFAMNRPLFAYSRKGDPFAFVMRSMKLVCIDIDGKNGGFEHVKNLGGLPPTLAETSKSGNGYHLFYLVEEDWDETTGFGKLADRIGLTTGVDFRATGCVFHHNTQRWNNRELALLPESLLTELTRHAQKRMASLAEIDTILASDDPMEILMMHEQMISDLKAPIPAGRRNNTLFAIANQMKHAGVPDWEEMVEQRANEVGLDAGETCKLIDNVKAYGTQP